MTKPDAELRDLDKAIGYVDMPDNIASLTGIIELAMRFAQETTGLPMILQGQQGDATRTLGGMQMLHNNASTVMRRLARTYDDSIQVPHMQRYYQWLLAYGQDNRAKGEFIVNARGSSTLVEREIQQQGLMQMGQLVANPQFGIDPRRWAESLVKSQRLSWDDLRYQDPEWQKVVEALAQSAQAGDTRVEVAQIQAQSRLQLLEKEQEFDQAMAALDYEREQMERETTIAMRALEREDTEADRSASAQAQLNDIKAQLTALTMRLNTQKELSREARNRRSVAALSPPLEPAGRAPTARHGPPDSPRRAHEPCRQSLSPSSPLPAGRFFVRRWVFRPRAAPSCDCPSSARQPVPTRHHSAGTGRRRVFRARPCRSPEAERRHRVPHRPAYRKRSQVRQHQRAFLVLRSVG